VAVFARVVEGVALRSLVEQAQVAVVRQLGVEEGAPEQDEGQAPAGMFEAGHNLLDLDHNLLVGHFGKVGHSPSEAHTLQEVVLD